MHAIPHRISIPFFFIAILTLTAGCESSPCPDRELVQAESWIVDRQYDSAIVFLDSLALAFPECGKIFYHRAMAYEWKDQPASAVEDYARAARFVQDSCPDLPDALIGRAWNHTKLRAFADAASDYRSAIILGNTCENTREPEDFLRLALANCYYEMGQYSDALEELDILLVTAEGFDWTQAMYAHGRTLFALGNLDAALEDFAALKGSPFDKNGWMDWYTGLIRQQQQMPGEACIAFGLAAEKKHPLADSLMQEYCNSETLP